MEHNANVATVGPANILRRRPEVNIYAAFRISKSVECVHYAFQKIVSSSELFAALCRVANGNGWCSYGI